MFTDEEISELGDDTFNTFVQEEAVILFRDWKWSTLDPYDYTKYNWSSTPTFDYCSKCAVWERFPKPQRHFGYRYNVKCGIKNCPCKHHKDELWYG